MLINTGPLISHIRLKQAIPEWTPEEIPEFVPGGYDQSQASESHSASSLAAGFENYAQYSALQSVAPQPSITNPYLQDVTGGISGATYYQGTSTYTQPVCLAISMFCND